MGQGRRSSPRNHVAQATNVGTVNTYTVLSPAPEGDTEVNISEPHLKHSPTTSSSVHSPVTCTQGCHPWEACPQVASPPLGKVLRQHCSWASTGLGHGTGGLPQAVPSETGSQPPQFPLGSFSLTGHPSDEILGARAGDTQRAEFTVSAPPVQSPPTSRKGAAELRRERFCPG